jgi:hypothetical protein
MIIEISLLYSTLLYSTLLYSTLLYSTLLYSTNDINELEALIHEISCVVSSVSFNRNGVQNLSYLTWLNLNSQICTQMVEIQPHHASVRLDAMAPAYTMANFVGFEYPFSPQLKTLNRTIYFLCWTMCTVDMHAASVLHTSS